MHRGRNLLYGFQTPDSDDTGYSFRPPPVISAVAPAQVIELLTSKSWVSDVGALAIEAVKTQLAIHETRQKTVLANVDAVADGGVPSLFDSAVLKVAQSIGDDPEEDIETISALPISVLGRVAYKLVNIPYLVLCVARKSQAGEGDVDEWILRNEKWLKSTAIPFAVRQSEPTSKHRRSEQGQKITQVSAPADWARGLTRLSLHAEIVFPDSVLTRTSRIITRPSALSGFKVLDGKRSPVIHIQPSVDMFAQTFNEMTGGLLKGLNWDNVFIAGGIALGALLCTKDEQATNTPEQWKKSDVDLYIYGLGPVEANKKVQHIFDVFKANVPIGMPVLAVRNSKTITFFSKYPLRRIQVVLKLVGSPKDVLLNFDLDICAVGWDGKEVWMLPRAARALETGYTVFTMDLINGHYLGDRRATQEQRVFKYADKGYGIRILSSYLVELQIIENDTDKRSSLPTTNEEDVLVLLDVEKIAVKARAWTARAIEGLAEEGSFPPSPTNKSPPIISHASLQEEAQITEDPPRRSCMSGLGIFMRHVALWEHENAGDILIKKDDWAAQTYDQIYASRFNIGYNDSPDYSWDEEFTTEGFISQIIAFNRAETTQLTDNLWHVFKNDVEIRRVSDTDLQKELESLLVDGSFKSVQRMTHATSVDKILQPESDIILPLWLPRKFVEFVNELVSEKVGESGIQGYTISTLVQATKEETEAMSPLTDEAPILVLWRITSHTMWQHLHRAIDEVHEVLWSFHHANAGLSLSEEERLGFLLTQFSRRAIRKTAQDEFMAFARWVGREPVGISNYNEPLGRAEDRDGDGDE